MTGRKRKITDGIEILKRRYVGDDPARQAMLQDERVNVRVARMIYDLRAAAKLTQRQLAAKVGTTTSVICRLDDADYDGHSLNMLSRIAAALGKQLKIECIPAQKRRASA